MAKKMKLVTLETKEITPSKISVKPIAQMADEKYPFAMGDSVVVIDSTPVGRHNSSSPMGEGNWEGIDYTFDANGISRQVVKVLIDGATKEFPYGTEVNYQR